MIKHQLRIRRLSCFNWHSLLYCVLVLQTLIMKTNISKIHVGIYCKVILLISIFWLLWNIYSICLIFWLIDNIMHQLTIGGFVLITQAISNCILIALNFDSCRYNHISWHYGLQLITQIAMAIWRFNFGNLNFLSIFVSFWLFNLQLHSLNNRLLSSFVWLFPLQ